MCVRPEFQTARELGEQLLSLAQRADDPALAGHRPLCPWGDVVAVLGELPAARPHLEQGIALYDARPAPCPVFRMGTTPGCCCRSYAAWTLWLLGYPDQALQRIHEALTLAHELAHPFSLAFARCLGGHASISFAGTCQPSQEQAEAAIALATEQGFPLWAAWGTILRGWALADAGPGRGGDRPDPPGAGRLAGHRGRAVRAVLSGPAGRGVWDSWASRKRGCRRWPRR